MSFLVGLASCYVAPNMRVCEAAKRSLVLWQRVAYHVNPGNALSANSPEAAATILQCKTGAYAWFLGPASDVDNDEMWYHGRIKFAVKGLGEMCPPTHGALWAPSDPLPLAGRR